MCVPQQQIKEHMMPASDPQQEITHFELAPLDGDCSKRTIEVEVWKGSWLKESCGESREGCSQRRGEEEQENEKEE